MRDSSRNIYRCTTQMLDLYVLHYIERKTAHYTLYYTFLFQKYLFPEFLLIFFTEISKFFQKGKDHAIIRHLPYVYFTCAKTILMHSFRLETVNSASHFLAFSSLVGAHEDPNSKQLQQYKQTEDDDENAILIQLGSVSMYL